MVFDSYQAADVAFKIVGTGSVGTRDYVVLLFGNGLKDPLFIQVKQELPSCHEPYLPSAPRADHQPARAEAKEGACKQCMIRSSALPASATKTISCGNC